MVKWLLTLFIVLVILAVATPWLGRYSGRFVLGRLPGDLRIPLRGRMVYVPFASTVLLSLLVWALGRLL